MEENVQVFNCRRLPLDLLARCVNKYFGARLLSGAEFERTGIGFVVRLTWTAKSDIIPDRHESASWKDRLRLARLIKRSEQ